MILIPLPEVVPCHCRKGGPITNLGLDSGGALHSALMQNADVDACVRLIELGSSGEVNIFNASCSTHLIVDVAGWFPG